jgi:hypothetical protein
MATPVGSARSSSAANVGEIGRPLSGVARSGSVSTLFSRENTAAPVFVTESEQVVPDAF